MDLSGTPGLGGVTLISMRPSSGGLGWRLAASRSAATNFSVPATSRPKPYQPLAWVTARRNAGAVRPPTTMGTGDCTGRGMACTPSNDT